MVFNTEYYSTLDRGFYHTEQYKDPIEVEFPEPSEQSTNLTAKEIGTGLNPMQYPLEALKAKIREGAAKVELTFMGTGKGSSQASTPESMGRLERQEMQRLSKINEVEFSTHATPNIMGVSGFNPQAGKFDDDMQQKYLKEIEKAIHFAAEASTGGAIVFHTGEWTRPIMEAGLSKDNRITGEGGRFREYATELQKAPIMLADPERGNIVQIPRDTKFYFPEEEYDNATKMSFIKVDGQGNPIVKQYGFHDAIKHIKEIHQSDTLLKNKSDEEILIYGINEQNLKSAQGEVGRFMNAVETDKKTLKKLVEARDHVQKVWDSTPESQRWRLMEEARLRVADPAVDKYLISDIKNPLEIFSEAEKNLRRDLEGHQKIVVSAQERYQQLMDESGRFKSVDKVGLERSTDAIAKLGLKTMEAYEKNKKNLNQPLFLSPESFLPDYYGSHPSEIRTLVTESREKMAKELIQKRGMSESEAKEIAQRHIKGTIDTGHFNMWRQHFQGKPEEYDKWYLDELEKLAKEGILGHVHLTDNFGFDDEHLTPGQGNAPIKEFVKRMEKAGIRDFIVEGGSFNPTTTLPDTLAELGSPLYALGRRINWSHVRNGHFGYAAPANYIVGAYAPSNEWRLWSEVPLE